MDKRKAAKKSTTKKKSSSATKSKSPGKTKKMKMMKEEAKLAHQPLDVIPMEDRIDKPRGSSEVPAHMAANNRRQQSTKDYARRVQSAR